MASPTVQTAWVCTAQGHPSEVLRLRHDHLHPSQSPLAAGDVIIKVQAAALNPVGHKLINTMPLASLRPTVPEFELAGTIWRSADARWKEGDAVVAHIDHFLSCKTRQGALAQYIRVSGASCVRRPANVKPSEAAGVPLAGMTAWQGLFELGGLQDGQSVFVNGGSTAVGSYAIQWAKARGCRVAATASGRNEAYVRGLGADEFIDYTKHNVPTLLTNSPPATKFHIVFDCVGQLDARLYLQSPHYLARGGAYVTVGPQPGGLRDLGAFLRVLLLLSRPRWLGGVDRPCRIVAVKTKREDMEAMFALLAEGKAHPVVDSVYSMENALKAYERLMSNRATGKVVVRVDPTVE